MSRLGRPRAAARRAVGVVTPLGRTIVVLAVIAWVAGVLLGWRELLAIAGTCGLILIAAALFMLGSVRLSTTLTVKPPRVTAGEPAAGSLTFRNDGTRRNRSVRVVLPVGSGSATFTVPRLTVGEKHEELFVVPTQRRAVITVGPVTTVQGDPLGLMRRTREWSERYEIYVHPVTTFTDTLAVGLLRDLEGQQTSHVSDADIAFHALRDYVPGDDLRHVHWKKTAANRNNLLVRQYIDTRRTDVAVVLSCDADEYQDDDEFELAVSGATSVALQALRDGATVTFVAGSAELETHDRGRLLDRISALGAHRGVDGLDTALATTRRVAANASIAVASVGSVPSMAAVRRSTMRLGTGTLTAVIRNEQGGVSGYTIIGTGRFVSVPRLDRLRPNLRAVLG